MPKLTACLDERQKAVAKHVEKFANRATIFLCCVLPIVEVTELIDYFKNNDKCEGLIAVQRAVTRWLESPRFISMAIVAGVNPSRLKEHFENLNNEPCEQQAGCDWDLEKGTFKIQLYCTGNLVECNFRRRTCWLK